MPTYSFKITKGKYQLSLSTTDRELVVNQFALWVRSASDYVKKHKIREGKERIENRINEEKEITQKKIEEQLQKLPQSEPVEEAPISEKELSSREENEKNLDMFYAPKNKSSEENLQENEEYHTKTTLNEIQKDIEFEEILDNSIKNPQAELSFKPSPAIHKDNAFLNYMSGRKITRSVDYLLLTAYYFTQYEQKPRFTLKQLNAKLMQNLAIILDHSVIQEGINRDYIECLPDLTGVIGASEYRLTAYGEKTLLEE